MRIPDWRTLRILLGSLAAGFTAFACAHTVVVESFDMSAPEERCGRYLEELAYAMTGNFRPRYEKRNSPQ